MAWGEATERRFDQIKRAKEEALGGFHSFLRNERAAATNMEARNQMDKVIESFCYTFNYHPEREE